MDKNGQCKTMAATSSRAMFLPEKKFSSVEKQVFYGFIIWIHCSLSHQSQTYVWKKKALNELSWIYMECRSSSAVLACACTFRSVLTTYSHMFVCGFYFCRQFNYRVILHIIMRLCVQQVPQSRVLPHFGRILTSHEYIFEKIQNQIAIIIIICWHVCRTNILSLHLSEKIVEKNKTYPKENPW